MSLKSQYDVVVVGAGITGASVAWHASVKGLKTAVIDASGPAAGATGAADGALSVASKKPGFMARLAGESLTYCRTLACRDGVLENIFRTRQSYLFARSDVECAALDRLSMMLGDPHLPVSISYDGRPDRSSVATANLNVKRLIELTGEGHMLGYEATAAFLAASRADFGWPCKLRAFEPGADNVILHTDAGEIRTTSLVLANGLGASEMLPDLPLTARSGQLIITDRAKTPGCPVLRGPLTSAAYLLDKSAGSTTRGFAPVVIDPLATGQLLIGSSREDGGDESTTDFQTVRRLLSSSVACLPSVAHRRVIRVFAGVRTACADGIPIVGQLRDAPNVILATGFEGDGICLAPLVGREIAATLTGGRQLEDFGALSPDRFQQDLVAVQ